MENVHLNRKNYRILLLAMSSPGRMFRLDKEEQEGVLFPHLAIARCLLDQEVSFCVFGGETMDSAIISATGARSATLQDADFIFTFGATGGVPILQAKRGSPEAPEQGATLVCCVSEERVDPLDGLRVRLAGPGIPANEGIVPEMSGIALEDLRALQTANADYPIGVDAIFVCQDGGTMCIPRSCRIQLR